MTKQPDEQLETIQQQAQQDLTSITNSGDLESWRIKYIGRKGQLPRLLRQIKELPPEQRAVAGQAGNTARQKLETAYQKKQQQLTAADSPSSDLPTTPPAGGLSLQPSVGHLHPLTLSLRLLREIFSAMDFHIIEGPDIEEAKYNFDQLNIAFEHPARAETDTFYLANLSDLVLRTHVSPLQIRGVLEHDLTPPFRTMYYGPSFRAEKEDATHLAQFYQYEFMVVEEKVNLADLKSIVQTLFALYFGRQYEIRFRPAYYPFVEPGLDVDARDSITGKANWLEMCGAGIVHPNVLRNINVDPDKYQGIALGGGLDRLTMLKYSIPDARLFYSGDVRFLKQFS